MSAMKRILKGQTWIEELKQIKAAVKAVQLYAAMYIPAHIKQEMRIAAATSQVPYFDLLCCNLAYEIAMIATTPGKLDLGGMWKSLAGLPAARVGCTAFGYWGGTGHFPCNTAVLFARNLDWADPDGLLKRHTRSARYKARPKKPFWSVAKPMKGFHSLTFPGYSGVLTGYAPGRFAVSLNAVFNDAAISFGAAPSMLTRQALETCRTYADAIRLLARTPLVCGALFTVIDADPCAGTNAGCVVERSARSFAIRHAVPVGVNDWAVCATNDYLANQERRRFRPAVGDRGHLLRAVRHRHQRPEECQARARRRGNGRRQSRPPHPASDPVRLHGAFHRVRCGRQQGLALGVKNRGRQALRLPPLDFYLPVEPLWRSQSPNGDRG